MSTPLVRVLSKVAKAADGCWVFTGSLSANGYGSVSRGARGEGRVYAHRLVFEHYKGDIPAGADLDHLCRNRACCNPDHLEPVTRRENLLRGIGPTALNASKTHCKRGHEFTEQNTRHDGRGRQCRACDRIRRGKEIAQ